MDECFFYRIVREDLPVPLIYKDEQVVTTRETHSAILTHILPVPNQVVFHRMQHPTE